MSGPSGISPAIYLENYLAFYFGIFGYFSGNSPGNHLPTVCQALILGVFLAHSIIFLTLLMNLMQSYTSNTLIAVIYPERPKNGGFHAFRGVPECYSVFWSIWWLQGGLGRAFNYFEEFWEVSLGFVRFVLMFTEILRGFRGILHL